MQAGRRRSETMIDTMRTNYAAPLLRAFKQAPWRSQTQAVAMLSITLLTAAVVGGFYLAVVANLRSINRLAARAVALGFQPATGDQLEYMRVDSYPQNVHLNPPPRAI